MFRNVSGGFFTQCRWRRLARRHKDDMFRKERAKKCIEIDLPNYDKRRGEENSDEEQTAEKLRTQLKKAGMPPTRQWGREQPIHMACTSEIIEPYQPKLNEGLFTRITKLEGKDWKEKTLSKTYKPAKGVWDEKTSIRKIKKYFPEWTAENFALIAQDIYIEAHHVLMRRDEDRLHELVTEKAYPDMWNELKLRSLKWEWVETVEPSKIVKVRCAPILTPDNTFAQATVRFRSKQILAIYDQFGRLMLGDEHIPRDVLEYVCFENHLVNIDGKWRVHGKILIPDDDVLESKQPVIRTFVRPPPGKTYDDPELDEPLDEIATQEGDESHKDEETPKLAAA